MNSFPMARVAPEKADFRPALPLGFLPDVNGTQMSKMTYSEQLKHPNWQRRRLEVLEGAGWACQNCGDKGTTLHVHHKRYIKGRSVWEYSGEELLALCEPCHAEEHLMLDELHDFLAQVDTTEALAVLRGYWQDADWFDLQIGYSGTDRMPEAWAAGFIAMLAKHLKPADMKRVAEFAVSLTAENSEERNRFASYGIEFDSLG